MVTWRIEATDRALNNVNWHNSMEKKKNLHGGPRKTSFKWRDMGPPISKVISTPVTHLCSTISKGYNSMNVWVLGAHFVEYQSLVPRVCQPLPKSNWTVAPNAQQQNDQRSHPGSVVEPHASFINSMVRLVSDRWKNETWFFDVVSIIFFGKNAWGILP